MRKVAGPAARENLLAAGHFRCREIITNSRTQTQHDTKSIILIAINIAGRSIKTRSKPAPSAIRKSTSFGAQSGLTLTVSRSRFILYPPPYSAVPINVGSHDPETRFGGLHIGNALESGSVCDFPYSLSTDLHQTL